jgi:hypothetical protein
LDANAITYKNVKSNKSNKAGGGVFFLPNDLTINHRDSLITFIDDYERVRRWTEAKAVPTTYRMKNTAGKWEGLPFMAVTLPT